MEVHESTPKDGNHKHKSPSTSREEGELSDDEHDEDSHPKHSNWGNARRKNKSWSATQYGFGGAERHRTKTKVYPSFIQQHHRSGSRNTETSPPQQSSHAGYLRKKRSHQNWERQREDDSENQPLLSHSKIWENHRLRRASSIRPSSPVLVGRVSSPSWQEGEDEYTQLMKEHKRIQDQLKSLEYEEEKSIYSDHQIEEEERNKLIENEQLLEDMAKLQTLPDSDSQIEHAVIEMEDISEEEDFDEQELRRLALATSARHNQLISSEVDKESVSFNQPGPSAVSADPEVVIIPDVEPVKNQEPVVVVVEEEENLAGKAKRLSKEEGKKNSHKKNSKSSKRSHGKRKKKETTKLASKISSPSRLKGNVDKKDWHLQQKILHALGVKDADRAMEKLSKLFKEPQPSPKPQKLTGTMGDFKRQNRLPLLSKTQNIQGKKSKADKALEDAEKKKPSSNLQDNYEEVEMEIESDKEDNALDTGGTNSTLETLQLGSDFSQAMQPIPTMVYGNTGLAYQANPFMTLSSTSSMLYQNPSLVSIPLPPLPPLPAQPPPLPPTEPSQPPPPKSPPPPPPPLSMQASVGNMPSMPPTAVSNSDFFQASNQLQQQQLLSQIPCTQLTASHSSAYKRGQSVYDLSRGSVSYRTNQPSTSASSTRGTDNEKNRNSSTGSIELKLHQLRKELTTNHQPTSKSRGAIDMNTIYDNVARLRKLASQSIEHERGFPQDSSQRSQHRSSVDNPLIRGFDEYNRRLSSDQSLHSVKAFEEKRVSFRLSSKTRDDKYCLSSGTDKFRQNLDNEFGSSVEGSRASDRLGRDKMLPDYSSDDNNSNFKGHGRSTQHFPSPQSPHSHNSLRRHSPKRKLDPLSHRKETLKRSRETLDSCLEYEAYEPGSPHRKHSRDRSPPPYIPTKTTKWSEDERVEVPKETTDDGESEDDLDADFLRKQLLTDMIKRRNIDLEKENSLDSSCHKDLPPITETDNQSGSKAEDEPSENPDNSEQLGTADDNDIVKSDSDLKDKESDEDDLVPPPVVSRVWNRPADSDKPSSADTGSIESKSRSPSPYHPGDSLNQISTSAEVLKSSHIEQSALSKEYDNVDGTSTSHSLKYNSINSPQNLSDSASRMRDSRPKETEGISEIKDYKSLVSIENDEIPMSSTNDENSSTIVNSDKVDSGSSVKESISNGDDLLPTTDQAFHSPMPFSLPSQNNLPQSDDSHSSLLQSNSNSKSNDSLEGSTPCISLHPASASSVSVNHQPATTTCHNQSLSAVDPVIQTSVTASIAQGKTVPQHSVVERTQEINMSRKGSRNSSPLRDGSHTIVQSPQPKYPAMIIPPVHPSVIVPLNTSSDEEQDEENRVGTGDLYPEEIGQDQSELSRLWKEDNNLYLKKQAILESQEKLKILVSKINQRHRLQEKAMVKIQALEKQISQLHEEKLTADKVAKSHEQVMLKTKIEARAVKDQLLEMRHEFLEKAKSVMGIGQVLVGAAFIPTALRSAQNNQKLVKKKSAMSIQQISKAQQIAAEKQKLKEKEKEIAEKLKRLKETSMQGMIRRVFKKSSKTKNNRKIQSEKGVDVIRLGKESSQDVVVVRQRRKSILMSDNSTTPNLPKTPRRSISNESNDNISLEKKSELPSRNSGDVFKMPSDSQLSNLCKLQAEKVEKIFSSAASNLYIPNTNPFMLFVSLSEGELQNANAAKGKRQGLLESTPMAYTSPLRAFRAYRFSPFYRTKENLSLISASHSHKINPNSIMCPYDLQGICNDDNCKQQHPKDYALTEKETLEDLVAYYPKIAGVESNASPHDIQKAIASYVDEFITKHKGRMLLEELCLILTMEASKVAGRDHPVSTRRRKWRPEPKGDQGLSLHLERKTSRKTLNSLETFNSRPFNKDDQIGDDDLRYFTGDGSELSSLEAGVVENPQNASLWLQLSARKLADPNRPVQECLDQGLNILARGLETNKSSSELWLQYLKLYQRHDEVTDVPQFCLMALEYAPSYELWFLYLNSLKSYEDKDEASRGTLDYLLSLKEDRETTDSSSTSQSIGTAGRLEDDCQDFRRSKELSHHTFEMIVFRVSLNILSGRFKTALKFLQCILGLKKEKSVNENRLVDLLTGGDHMALWLVYIYMLEWQQLPSSLMEASSDLPGRLVCKDINLPWSTKPKLNSSLDTLVNLHLLACKVWSKAKVKVNRRSMESGYTQVVKSLTDVLVSQGQLSKALSCCQKVLRDTHLVDVWILYASLCDINGNKDSVLPIFDRALESNDLNPKIKFHQVLFLTKENQKDEALTLLEQFILDHFQTENSTLDPNILFCQLLKQDEGFSLCESKVKKTVPSDLHKDVFMWMCYCFLLELQGEVQETIEAYERSLSQVQSASDLVVVWKNYISFLVRSGQLLQSWPEVLTRSIISLPVKQPQLSGNGGTVVDYRHSNQIMETWLQVLPASHKIATVEMGLDLMPGNVTLLLRGLQLCVEMRETRRAYCWCRMVLAQSDRPSNLSFWKMATALAHKEGSQSEVEQFLVGGVESMTLAVSAWKDFLLFEVSREDNEMVTKILSHCGQLGLNIEGFVATISSQN